MIDILKYIDEMQVMYGDKEPSSMDQEPRNMADGERTGFFKAGLVKQGPNTGKWSVPDFDPGSRNTVFFESEETANKAIADRKIKTSRYEKSRNILNDPKLKKEFLKYAMGKDVTGKMIRKKYGLGNEEFFEGGLRDIIDKDFKKFSEGGIKQKTIKNMVLLHNNKLSKNYITKGLIIPNNIIEKLGLNSSEAATATTRLSQHYGGFDFGFDELKNIRRNAKASDKLFEAMNKFAFGNPYRSALYSTSLELIDKQLGNERGTFSSLKNKARKVLKANKIKGFDINEIAGVTGTARTGVGEFSQFMDVMDRNLNQKEMASFQSAFSRARQNIKNNPKNFATQSKQINKLAADFERRYNVELPRIRNAADVEKYYSPKRLQELKDQGLDIKKASKKLKYTIEMPKSAITVTEFVNDPKKQSKALFSFMKRNDIKCSLSNGIDCGRPEAYVKSINELKAKAAAGDKAAAKKLVEVTKGMSKGGKLLRSLIGPGAILFEPVYEGVVAANKVLNGKPLNQAWAESYLSYLDSERVDPKTLEREEMLYRQIEGPERKVKGGQGTVRDIINIDGGGASKLRPLFAAEDTMAAFEKAKKEKRRGEFISRKDIENKAAADIRDMRKTGSINFAQQTINDPATQEALSKAQEYIAAKRGAASSIPQSAMADERRRREAMKADGMLTIEDAKNELQDIGDYYGQGYTPFGLNKLFEEAGMQNPGYGITKVGPATGKYNQAQGLQDYLNSMRMQNIADAGGVANMADGGIAGLSGGDKSGRPPESGPASQGLRSLFNNGKKR